eukprot:TRINITY_DN22254_c0_g1_i1.p1 TRINITY_DN22254_c0_g1~~TRINITY_DN22254_c0_g1_i1.p1  ORF type:complete len:380 (+),score=60.56 TRINITY_DN22254_c0_g1_i1:102-1142(+)
MGALGSLSQIEYEELDRVSDISSFAFLHQYIKIGKPVIVTDILRDWNESQKEFWKFDKMIQTEWFSYMAEHELKSTEDDKLEAFLHDHLPRPYCLEWDGEYPPDDVVELFYRTEVGPSTPPHVDTGCGFSYQLQLDGEKLWKFYPFSSEPIVSEHGTYYPKPLQGILKPGDTVFFAAGWIHSTYILQSPSMAVSIYWRHTNPEFDSQYYNEKVLPSLLNIREYCYCRKVWSDTFTYTDLINDVNCAVDRAIFGGGAQNIPEPYNYAELNHEIGRTFRIFLYCLLFFLGLLIYQYFYQRSWHGTLAVYVVGMLIYYLLDASLMIEMLADTELIPRSDILNTSDLLGN